MSDRRRFRVSVVAFEALLRSYPRCFREDYADLMLEAFLELAEQRIRARGGWGLALLWMEVIPDLARTAVGSHLEEWQQRWDRAGVARRRALLRLLLGLAILGVLTHHALVVGAKREVIDMTELFRHAGLFALPVLGLGALSLFLAIAYASTLSSRFLVLAAGSTLSTLLIGAMGTVYGFQVSLRHLATLPAEKQWRVGIGMLESMNDLLLSIAFAVVVTAILTLAAALRSRSTGRDSASASSPQLQPSSTASPG